MEKRWGENHAQKSEGMGLLARFVEETRYDPVPASIVNIWAVIRIRRFDESLDKVEQYVSKILWHQADFRKLLSKRIKSQFDCLGF